MREYATQAHAKYNGLSILEGLANTGKLYDSPYKAEAVAKRRKKAKAAKKMRKANR